MSTPRLSILTALVALSMACGPTEPPGLYMSSNVSTFDGRTQHAVVRVQAFTESGAPGQGVVSLVAPAGHFADGDQVTLIEGYGAASFLCDPAEDSACSGSIRLGATWADQHAAVTVRVTPAATSSTVRWKVVPTNTLATLSALAVADARTAWAVGSAGTVQRLTGSTWSPVASGTGEALLAVAVSDAGLPVVAGERGTLLRWRGDAFQALPGDAKEDYTAVASLGGEELVVGTASGQLLRYDGVTLTAEGTLGTAVLSLAVQGDQVWAGGEGAMAVRADGGWALQTPPVLAKLSIASASPEGVYLGGPRLDTSGGVLLLGPTQWKSQVLGSPVTAMAVVPQSTERFAVTASGVLRADSSTATYVDTSAPMGGLAAGSRAAGDLVVVGPPGLCLLRAP